MSEAKDLVTAGILNSHLYIFGGRIHSSQMRGGVETNSSLIEAFNIERLPLRLHSSLDLSPSSEEGTSSQTLLPHYEVSSSAIQLPIIPQLSAMIAREGAI